MEVLAQAFISVVVAVFASTGFWSFMSSKDTTKQAQTDMLKGLAHDRIISLGMEYIRNGEITKDQYNNLYVYLYKPYKTLDGNGSAEKIMKEVERLPLRKEDYI